MRSKLNLFEFFQNRPLLRILIGLGLILVCILTSDVPRMVISQDWPSTEGEIISRYLVGQKFKEYDGDFFMNIDGYIRYQYFVEDIRYTSNAINSIKTPRYPYDIAIQYPEGKDVVVHYNPKNPSIAVLEPGFIWTLDAFDVFSFLLFTVGLYFIFLGFRIKTMNINNQED